MKASFTKQIYIPVISMSVLVLLASIIFFTFPLPGQIPVLMYHFIGSKEAAESYGNVVTENTLIKQMRFLKRFGYHPISIEDYDAIRTGTKKARGKEIVLTFDDGNTSVAEKAMPILNSFHYPVTLFLISENLKTGNYGSMKTADVLTLGKNPLVSLGAHSRSHPFLSQIQDDQVISEIQGSKSDLELMLSRPIRYFAYPYGDFDERSMAAAQNSGYSMAFTTSPKRLKKFVQNSYSIPRVKISENASNPFIFWIKISGIYECFKLWRHERYYKTVHP